ncbi:uncharacterized protein V1513DRAFT_434071 [Lipomyces chichibuensis]|uniref:uncharacterized protein n=1 Tax=Lipomyces chichibuensis TaxID=1546026 RepID=UPI003343B562
MRRKSIISAILVLILTSVIKACLLKISISVNLAVVGFTVTACMLDGLASAGCLIGIVASIITSETYRGPARSGWWAKSSTMPTGAILEWNGANYTDHYSVVVPFNETAQIHYRGHKYKYWKMSNTTHRFRLQTMLHKAVDDFTRVQAEWLNLAGYSMSIPESAANQFAGNINEAMGLHAATVCMTLEGSAHYIGWRYDRTDCGWMFDTTDCKFADDEPSCGYRDITTDIQS